MAATEPTPDDTLPGDEIRQRAVAGAAVVGARGVAINVLAFLGNVALARLLVPEDYGTIALGLAILTLAMLLSDGGLGAGLVRRPEPPTADDMRAFMAVQLGASLGIAGLAVAIGVPLGGAGPIVAIMLASLPILALRGPALVWLQRQIDFRPLAAVEVSEALAYYAFGIAAVAAGLGVWGLAAASIVKALTGTALLLRGRRHMVVRPRVELSHIRPMLRFGLRFQGVQVVGSIRDQGISVGIAAVAGSATLALWTVAWRLLQVPFLLFQALWHVSFPAMAQLIAGGEEPRPVVERLAALAAAGTGLLLTALAASTPSLIPALFGGEYAGAREAIPPVCAALQISGPVSVAAAGYLFASGQAGVALRAALLQVLIWYGLALSLLPVLGVRAVGLGFCAAALAETVVFVRAVHRHIGARLIRELVAPFAAAAVGSACGWMAAEAVGPSLPGAIAGGAVGTGIYLALMVAARRALVVEIAGFVRRGAVSLVRA